MSDHLANGRGFSLCSRQPCTQTTAVPGDLTDLASPGEPEWADLDQLLDRRRQWRVRQWAMVTTAGLASAFGEASPGR